MKCRFCWGGTEPPLPRRRKKPHQIWIKLLGGMGKTMTGATSPHGWTVAFCLTPGTIAKIRFWGAWEKNKPWLWGGQGGVRDGCKGLVGRAPGRSWLCLWGSVRHPWVMPSTGTCQGFSSRFSFPQPLWDRSISAAALCAERPRGGMRQCGGSTATA